MKTALDKTTREELISRINSLSENSTAKWGKMNVHQMVEHNIRWEEMIDGDLPCKRSLVGRLIGQTVLKSFLKGDKQLGHNSPTAPELKVTEIDNDDLAAEKKRWIDFIKRYEDFQNEGFVHPFFGKMTGEQIGYIVYKHCDHHLRQFNS
jgi:hypothetical protein